MSTINTSEDNPKDCSQSHDNPAGSPSDPAQPATKKPVSERKRQANRENSKKSTGPKTASGKRTSSFNATKHGMLAKKVMYGADGQLLDENAQRLLEALREEYGCGDVATELLTELVVVDYSRLQKGLEFERKYLAPRSCEFAPQGGMPTLIRYNTANRHSIEKTLTTLIELGRKNPAAEDDSTPDESLQSDAEESSPDESKKEASPAADESPRWRKASGITSSLQPKCPGAGERNVLRRFFCTRRPMARVPPRIEDRWRFPRFPPLVGCDYETKPPKVQFHHQKWRFRAAVRSSGCRHRRPSPHVRWYAE
jgi:hypothetical protein